MSRHHSPAPIITAFFDEPTNTISYLVADPVTRRAAVIDPVLDFDQRDGTVDIRSVEAILAAATGEADDRVGAGDPRARRPPVGRALYQIQNRCEDRHRRAHQGRAADLPPVFNAEDLRDRRQRLRPPVRRRRDVPASVSSTSKCCTRRATRRPTCRYKIGDAVFVGDTLFMPDYGTARADFPGGDARQLYRSIQRLLALPAETRLFMCHDYKAPGRDTLRLGNHGARAARQQRPSRGGVTEDAVRRDAQGARRDAGRADAAPAFDPGEHPRRAASEGRATACTICCCRFARRLTPPRLSCPRA